MNMPFRPSETPPEDEEGIRLVELDDGRLGLLLDGEARAALRGIADGLAATAIALVLLVAVIATIRLGLRWCL